MKQALAVFGLMIVTAFTGCGGESGPPTAQAKGKVTVAGKGALTGGSIQFILVSDSKQVGGGQIQADGSYDVNAPVGECKVTVSNDYLKARGGGMGGPAPAAPGGMGAPQGVGVPPGAGNLAYMPIDPAFASPDTTTLKSTVSSSGATPSDFEVK